MQKSAKSKSKFSITPYLFIAPHVILFIVFFLIPTFYGIYTSFTKWNIYSDPTWVGLQNYKTIFFDSESTFYRQFWEGLRNTITFVLLCVPFQIIIPLAVSLALFGKPKGRNIFQSIFYLPTLLSISSVTISWIYIFNRSLGLFNNLFGTDINWNGQQPYTWIAIVVMTLWWMIGKNMIIYVAALSGIDHSVLESAEMDGANGLKRIWYVILPSIKFQLIYTLITSLIEQFNIYGQPLLFNSAAKAGAPNGTTYVLLMYVRNLAFGTGNPIAGVAGAMATSLGIIIGVISVVQLVLLKNQET